MDNSMNNILDIIIYNDDETNSRKIWLNGFLIKDIDKIEDLILNIIQYCNNRFYDNINLDSIYFKKDFPNYETDKDGLNNLRNWFNSVSLMDLEQVELIKKRKWYELLEKI